MQHSNYWKRLHELKLYSLQRHRESYIILYTYLEDNAAFMMPYIGGTMGYKMKTRKYPRHGTQYVNE